MKQVILFAVLSFFGNKKITAQSSTTSTIGVYKWCDAILIQPSDLNGVDLTRTINGRTVSKPAILSLPSQKFRVIKLLPNNFVIIQILDYTVTTNVNTLSPDDGFYKYNFTGTSADYNNLGSGKTNERMYEQYQAYFKVDIKYINENAISDKMIKGSLAVGVINYPFKYRMQKGHKDFSGAFNFGAGIGYTVPHKVWREWTFTVITGYSISSIILDSSNTSMNQGKLASTNNFSAFSFSTGAIFQYQNVQAGVFLGWDRLNKINHDQFNWAYQGKPWVSVGFGLAIFSKENTRNESKVKTSQSD